MRSPRREITALRLSAQRILGTSDLLQPVDVARRMLALQSQDLPGARWAIGLRLAGGTDADVERALASGEIVRSWPMRGTLHITAPEDLGWMLDIAARRQATAAAKRRSDLGITDEQLARAGDIAVELMAGGTAVRRDALLTAWESRGIPTTQQRGYTYLWNLAHGKLIVFGPPDAKQPTFALFEEWVATHRPLDGDEALAEFAGRYIRSHGPATERDLAWWAGITLGEARRGIAAATGIERRSFGGVDHYLAEGLEPAASGVVVLPGFDEYLLGYQDRSAALAAEFAQRIVPGSNGMFLPTVVVDGEVVGTWKRADAARKATVDIAEFTALGTRARSGLRRAVRRYGQFLGKPVELRD